MTQATDFLESFYMSDLRLDLVIRHFAEAYRGSKRSLAHMSFLCSVHHLLVKFQKILSTESLLTKIYVPE